MLNPTPAVRAPNSADLIRPEFARSSGDAPLVSIGIPAYKRPNLLAEALASIAAQRTEVPFEVVVCDDGGLPETRNVAERSGIANLRFYRNQPRLGPVANWNRCLEVAAAPWVTVLHEDDLLYPWFLAHVAPRLRKDVVAVAVRCVQGPTPPALNEPAPADPKPYRPLYFLKASMTPFPGVVVSRALALEIGGFPAAQRGLADYAFWYALACRGPVATLRSPAAFYRVNEGQWTDEAWPQMLRTAHVLRRRIAREQLPRSPGLGRWIARFYTARMARAYDRRFEQKPTVLARAQQFERIPFSRTPSGWVWLLLKLLAR